MAGATVLMETEEFRGNEAGVGLGGTLTVLPGGCVGIYGEDPRDGVLLLFPAGTRVAVLDSRIAVSVPGDDDSRFPRVTLRPGDVIQGGSRHADGFPVSADGDLSAHTPPACRGYRATSLDAGVILDPRF